MNMKRNLPAVRVSMFPKDTNATGKNIFGGVILSHMDTAGGIAAKRVCSSNIVTVAFDQVIFKQPVHIGDLLTCWAELLWRRLSDFLYSHPTRLEPNAMTTTTTSHR